MFTRIYNGNPLFFDLKLLFRCLITIDDSAKGGLTKFFYRDSLSAQRFKRLYHRYLKSLGPEIFHRVSLKVSEATLSI